MSLRRGLLLVCALMVLTPGPHAMADAPVASGWWYRLQSGLSPVAVPPPPDAPPDGLYIALDPSGPLAEAAVSYSSASPDGGTLTLTFAGPPKGTPSIDACVATAPISGAQAGAWEKKPGFDCNAGRAEGTLAPDGASIVFTLDAAFVTPSETIDAVLIPSGSAPFTAPIAKPGAESFAPSSSAPAGGEGGFVPDPGTGFETDPGTSLGGGGAVGEPLDPGGALGGAAPLPASPTTPADGGAGSGGGGDGGGGGVPVAAPSGDPSKSTDQLPKTFAVALLGALGAAYWFLSNRAEPAPRLIGGLTARHKEAEALADSDEIAPIALSRPSSSTARRAAHPVGGLGRFARPRDNLPNRL